MVKITRILIPITLIILLAMGCAEKVPPTVKNINPNKGPSGGGTAITITGEGFKEGTTVTIGGAALKEMKINIPEGAKVGTSITGVVPGGKPGAQKVEVTIPDVKEQLPTLTFTYEGIAVVSTTPNDGDQLAWDAGTTEVLVTLSQDIQPGSAISVFGTVGEESYELSGEAIYEAATKTIAFTASESMQSGTSYAVEVSGVKDKAGNAMDTYSFGFALGEIPVTERVRWYKVKEGDTLKSIAAKPEVYNDETKANVILTVNQDEFVTEDGRGNDNILDPNNLKAGTDLYIPQPE